MQVLVFDLAVLARCMYRTDYIETIDMRVEYMVLSVKRSVYV